MDSSNQSFDGFGFPSFFESKERFKNHCGGNASFRLRVRHGSPDVHGVLRRSAS